MATIRGGAIKQQTKPDGGVGRRRGGDALVCERQLAVGQAVSSRSCTSVVAGLACGCGLDFFFRHGIPNTLFQTIEIPAALVADDGAQHGIDSFHRIENISQQLDLFA